MAWSGRIGVGTHLAEQGRANGLDFCQRIWRALTDRRVRAVRLAFLVRHIFTFRTSLRRTTDAKMTSAINSAHTSKCFVTTRRAIKFPIATDTHGHQTGDRVLQIVASRANTFFTAPQVLGCYRR